MDLYYQVEMPEVFFFDHPVGTVMGRGEYSDFFVFSQGCTVGNNHGLYPKFENYVSMMSNSKILGNCKIGHHVIIAANAYIKDMDIPEYSLVFGQYPDCIIKRNHKELIIKYFEGEFK